MNEQAELGSALPVLTRVRGPEDEESARLRALLERPLPEIPPIYFYDDEGSALFERITHLDAYYQTRTEIALLERHAPEILRAADARHLVELGSGAGRKIRLLLDAWRPMGPETTTLLDVNETFLQASLTRLRAEYSGRAFRGVIGDFTQDLGRLGRGGHRLTVFFGGTIGNLFPDQRRHFFQDVAARMADSDTLLLGVDLVKDPARLEAAYNDPEGVTAAFALRPLYVLNARFGADFQPDAFEHHAFYDARQAWIEMRLRATRPMEVHLAALDLTLNLQKGEEIRTEVSCKFTRDSLAAAATGLRIDGWYTDPEGLFALALMRKDRHVRSG